MEPEPLEPTLESLSQAFGFEVPASLVGLARTALRLRPQEPHRALEPLGLSLGGPLHPFLGGSPVPLRLLETPPELFPFGLFLGTNAHCGLVADDPGEVGGVECTVASLAPASSEGCQIEAPSLPGFLAARAARALVEPPPGARGPKGHPQRIERIVEVLSEEMELEWPADPERIAQEGLSARLRLMSYRTQDRLGVVVPEEPVTLELISLESRRTLIGCRDRDRVHGAGRRALKVGAPGAALALARDLAWTLGNRADWYRTAVELMEEAYPTLHRPLLARVCKREWARHYRP